MTEKRFTIDVEEETQENAIFLDGKFICFEDDSDKLVDCLNVFYGEYINLKTGLNFETEINNGKRFENDGRILIDNQTKLHYLCTLDWEVSLITKLLNRFHEENQNVRQLINKMLRQINTENIGDENAVYSATIIFNYEEFKLINDIWRNRGK